MTRIKVDKEVSNRLMTLRNRHGFLDLNYTIRYLLNNQDFVTKKELQKLLGKDIPTETISEKIEQPKSILSDEAIPIIVPTPNVKEPDVREVNCPKCSYKFYTDLNKPIKCPKCGTEGKSN